MCFRINLTVLALLTLSISLGTAKKPLHQEGRNENIGERNQTTGNVSKWEGNPTELPLQTVPTSKVEGHGLVSGKGQNIRSDSLTTFAVILFLKELDDKMGKREEMGVHTTKQTCPKGRKGKKCRSLRRIVETRNQLLAGLSSNFLSLQAELEATKRKCTYGDFYDYNKDTCESCDNYCADEEDLELCGYECRAYFREERLKEGQRNKDKETKANNVTLVVCVFLSGVVIGVVGCGCLTRRQNKMRKDLKSFSGIVKNIRDREYGSPEGDNAVEHSDGNDTGSGHLLQRMNPRFSSFCCCQRSKVAHV